MANFACRITLGWFMLAIVRIALARAPSAGAHCTTNADCPNGLQCLPPGRSSSAKSQFKCQQGSEPSEPGCSLALTGQPECSSEFTGQSGEITSPNYPNNYNPSSDCQYRITVAPGKRVQITIMDFDAEPGFDNLRIIDGCDVSGSTLIDELNGEIPSGTTYTSSHRVLLLQFTTDDSVQFRGFRIQYSEVA